jgi:hypothetical protein
MVINESELNKNMKLNYKTTQCRMVKLEKKINLILNDEIMKKKYQFRKIVKVNSTKNDKLKK